MKRQNVLFPCISTFHFVVGRYSWSHIMISIYRNVLLLPLLQLGSDKDGHQSARQEAYIGHTMHTI